jgi:hypothetical protein
MTPVKRRKAFLGGLGGLGESRALKPGPSTRANFHTGWHNAKPVSKTLIPSIYTMWLPGSPCSLDFLTGETNLWHSEVAGGVSTPAELSTVSPSVYI